MPSTPHWTEYNLASTSTTGSRADVNWKSVDDSVTTAYSAAPVTAGNSSFEKIQALIFDTGAWNNLSAFTYKINSNSTGPDQGWSVYGTTISAWSVPASSTTHDATLMSLTGITANFTTGAVTSAPFSAGTSTVAGSSTQPVSAQPLRTQLRTATSATPGDTPILTLTATWTES
jgi:hypothetical protein